MRMEGYTRRKYKDRGGQAGGKMKNASTSTINMTVESQAGLATNMLLYYYEL